MTPRTVAILAQPDGQTCRKRFVHENKTNMGNYVLSFSFLYIPFPVSYENYASPAHTHTHTRLANGQWSITFFIDPFSKNPSFPPFFLLHVADDDDEDGARRGGRACIGSGRSGGGALC